jgi:hypothetical protein
VWFAPGPGGRFLWISRPEARHSVNLAERPELTIVIFDSGARPEDRQALYVEARAEMLDGEERDAAVDRYSRHSLADDLSPLTIEDVTGEAPFRMYRATAERAYVLEDERDRRIPVAL